MASVILSLPTDERTLRDYAAEHGLKAPHIHPANAPDDFELWADCVRTFIVRAFRGLDCAAAIDAISCAAAAADTTHNRRAA